MNEELKSHELEAVVLSCLMQGAPFEEVSSLLSENDFQDENHKKIFVAIAKRALKNIAVDPISLLEEGLNIEAVTKVQDYSASVSNIAQYAKQLASCVAARNIKKHILAANSEISPANHLEVASGLASHLEQIIAKKIESSHDWESVVVQGIAEIDSLSRSNSQVIYSGLPGVDRKLSAIHGGRLVILAARPGTGKTALAQQLALESAKKGKAIGIVSLEMAVHELALRSFANSFNVNVTSLARGDVDSLSKVISDSGYTSFEQYKIYVDDSTYSLDAILAHIGQWKRKYNIDFVIVDHIGLVDVKHAGSRNEALGFVSRSFKQLSKKLNIPVIALCQLNRGIEKEDREPRLSDLRESGHIEQDADMVIVLKENFSNIVDMQPGDKQIQAHLLKNRVGPKGRIEPMVFKGRTQQFIY